MFFERYMPFSLRGVTLFWGDVFCIALSVTLAAVLRLGFEEGLAYVEANSGALYISGGIFLLVFYVGGMYERKNLTRKKSILIPSMATVSISLVLIMVVFYARFELLIGRGVLLLAALLTFFSVWALRNVYRMIAGYGIFSRHALIVGEGRDAATIVRLMREVPDSGYKIFGVVTPRKGRCGELIEGVPVLGHIDKLKEYVLHYRAETLVVATKLSREQALLKVLRPLRYAGVELLDYASFYERAAQEIPLDHIDDEWLMHAAMNSSRIHIRKLKRIMDVVVSLAGLILSVPICLVATILIKLDSPGPIFYRQRRLGLDSRVYVVNKFRTMRVDAESESGAVWAGRYDKRVTRIGRFLRKSRIDEIPQLINVLRGEMSLVGPRPERPEFVEALANTIPFYKERLLVPPGITGWAQVRYPYTASVQAARRKVQFDLYYIKHMSLFLDILILLRTFKTILVGLRHSEEEELAEAVEREQAELTVLSGGKAKEPEEKTA